MTPTVAETSWILVSQQFSLLYEVHAMQRGHRIGKSSPLLLLHQVIDTAGVLRVGGQGQNSMLLYHSQHPEILNDNHTLARLIVQLKHWSLLYACPTLSIPSRNRLVKFLSGQLLVDELYVV